MSGTIKAWSFSAWKGWKQCAFQFKMRRVLKLKEPVSPILERGSEVHDEAAAYLLGKAKKLPTSLKQFTTAYEELRAKKPEVEMRLAFDKSWKPVDDFFGPTVWMRCVIDALVIEGAHATVVDHKTSKPKEIFEEQLELNAISVFLRWPKVKTVSTELWYVDHGIVMPIPRVTYQRKDLASHKAKWKKRVTPMLNDKSFRPNPSYLCRYCHFRKDNDGPCEY